MFVLNVTDVNSQAIEAVLDDILYYIILDWNESGQYWTMGINNSAYQTLITGISISANYLLTYQFRYADMPAGELMVVSAEYRSGPVPKNGFSSGRYQLIYQTQQDLLTLGALPRLGFTSSVV